MLIRYSEYKTLYKSQDRNLSMDRIQVAKEVRNLPDCFDIDWAVYYTVFGGSDQELLTTLAYDREFCRLAGIPYHKIDLYWDKIRKAFMVCYSKGIR